MIRVLEQSILEARMDLTVNENNLLLKGNFDTYQLCQLPEQMWKKYYPPAASLVGAQGDSLTREDPFKLP